MQSNDNFLRRLLIGQKYLPNQKIYLTMLYCSKRTAQNKEVALTEVLMDGM